MIINGGGEYRRLIPLFDYRLKVSGLVHPDFNCLMRRDSPDQLSLPVDHLQRLPEVAGISRREIRYRGDSCRLQKLRVLPAYASYSEQVSAINPPMHGRVAHAKLVG